MGTDTKVAAFSVAAMVALLCAAAHGAGPASRPASATRPAGKVFAVVFDFAGPDGDKLADSVRLRLRRDETYDILDRISTQEASGPVGTDASRKNVAELMDQLAAGLAVYGVVRRSHRKNSVEVHCLDAAGAGPVWWAKTFTDESGRWRAVISAGIVEAIRGRQSWAPPQYGDDQEPKAFAKPLNANGDFDAGWTGWDSPDGASTFIGPGPGGRGNVLRIRTDLARDAWLAWRRKLMLGQADPARPPNIPRAVSYGSLAGMEGVHYKSDWIEATPGRRYWLVCDAMPPGGTPKVFVKGFRKTPHALDGLPEPSLAELSLTAEQLAAMGEGEQKRLIAADAAKHPMRYLRECYRWYLNMRGPKGEWTHHAAPFPPRGGLPAYVQWLQIQVYAYWPPGEYLFDDVQLYADPRQKDPLAEQKPRTPNFGKTSDVVERPTSRPSSN